MSLLDKAKAMAEKAKDQAAHLASQHGDKIDQALDKGGSFVDQRTHGKYADKVVKARAAAKQAAERLAAQAAEGGSGTTPPPSGPADPTPPTYRPAGTTPPPPPPRGFRDQEDEPPR